MLLRGNYPSTPRDTQISVISNIAEGYARRSDKAFANFLHIAHGSAAEVQSQLYITQDDFNRAYSLCNEINRQTTGLIKYLNTPLNSGS